MTYFELYNEPINLMIDASALKKTYYKLSMQYHPDKVLGNDAIAQDEALQLSASVNEGYKTLSDFQLRMAYILQSQQIITENETYQLPNDFLMEMMDLNEKIMDAKMENNIEVLALPIRN
jgi:molecular chaperone HscB